MYDTSKELAHRHKGVPSQAHAHSATVAKQACQVLKASQRGCKTLARHLVS